MVSPVGDPTWFQRAVIYEVHARSFFDSNDDGVGDLRGLREKLDHVLDLGATAIWLLPFYPSPLRDDGYDIADYTSVHPDLGTLDDVRALLHAAHERGLRVVTELVLNHTSDRHPWFQRARRALPGSAERDFYIWRDAPDGYREARIIFADVEPSNWTWDAEAQAYYWHRFYSHQPDLNFDNPLVRREVERALTFWMDMGVDGVRLDAVPYLYEREGTACEGLPETHEYLRRLRTLLDVRYGDRMLLAEANQWPEEAVRYFGDGDECHMAFHFPLMPRLFMALRMEDRFPIVDILRQTPPIPAGCQWATFLRNHDELTLEMVTDEDRDYMHRVYARDARARLNLGIRRRLAPLLGGDRRRIELMYGLLFSLPGAPVIYYGDEIGMGDNIYLGDRNGVRTPMQWSADRNAGFSRANPQRLHLPLVADPEYHYTAINVETQQANPHSLLWWVKRAVALRRRHEAFAAGTLDFVSAGTRKVLAFLRRAGDETILVAANLSRFAQPARLELPGWEGATPVELFGRTAFPPIGAAPYPLTLGPHSFLWLALRRPRASTTLETDARIPAVAGPAAWKALVEPGRRADFEAALSARLARRADIAESPRGVVSARLADIAPLADGDDAPRAALVLLGFTEGEPETTWLALDIVRGERAAAAALAPRDLRAATFADEPGAALVDVSGDPATWDALARTILRRRRRGALAGAFRGVVFAPTPPAAGAERPRRLNEAAWAVGEGLTLRACRRLEPGPHPAIETPRFLAAHGFHHAAAPLGALLYEPREGEPAVLAVLSAAEPSQGDAWSLTIDALARFFERALAAPPGALDAVPAAGPFDRIDADAIPAGARELLGTYAETAAALGDRLGELHAALASDPEDPDFAPEPFPPHHQRALEQSARALLDEALEALAGRRGALDDDAERLAAAMTARRAALEERCGLIRSASLEGMRLRAHGDLGLDRIAHTGRDFVFADFEGAPDRPLSERRIKRSPVRDVASLVQSIHLAAQVALASGAGARSADRAGLVPWAARWRGWAAALVVGAYLARTDGAPFACLTREAFRAFFDHFLFDRALRRLIRALEWRPDRAAGPLALLAELAGFADGDGAR
ncbi:MAG: maltose alpha-D-glucosyltransferase [Candidatus Polarisedimenticolia bacterium]